MFKKIALIIFSLLIIIFPACSFGAETNQEMDANYITRMQNEISADISKLQVSIEKELAEIKLTSTDIQTRIAELAVLSESVSEDMAAWGYNEEQREKHLRVLSELSIAYSAYEALLQSAANLHTAGQFDLETLADIESPDINSSYATRLEILKISRGLAVQLFYIQSRLHKLKIELAEAAQLQKELKEAQEGGKALDTPRTHVLDLEESRINIAISRVQIRDLKAAFDKNVSTIRVLRRRLEDMQGKLTFSQKILDANLSKIQERITELTEELETARKALDSANTSLMKARSSLGSADVNILTNASASYQARSARVSYWGYMVSMLDDEIDIRREEQEIWRKRYRLFHDEASGEEIWQIRDESASRIAELQQQLEGVRTMESTIIRNIESIEKSLKTEGLSSTIQQYLIQAADNQRKIISGVVNRYATFIPEAIFLMRRLNTEANDNLSALKVAEKVTSFSKETVMGFLDTELWNGEGYSVTVSKLIIAILVFLSSFFLSSWGSNWIKRRMINRFKASVTAANGVQRIVFYILWVAFALIALNIVKIPLTAFAFLGGAFALGIGFGMQNIFNNLISGFIVIFSRPFKVNDIVDVLGVQGTVSDIGSRSTIIKTWDGFDVIMPNKNFLENTVTNWTKSDLRKREILKVGVAYGSDTRQVEKLLLEVTKSHSQVLKNPAPFIIFRDFGDNSLDFEIYYWIELRTSSGMKVSSDLRHHIAVIFAREGIEIPFPQRDIHIIENNPSSNVEKLEEKKQPDDSKDIKEVDNA